MQETSTRKIVAVSLGSQSRILVVAGSELRCLLLSSPEAERANEGYSRSGTIRFVHCGCRVHYVFSGGVSTIILLILYKLALTSILAVLEAI